MRTTILQITKKVANNSNSNIHMLIHLKRAGHLIQFQLVITAIRPYLSLLLRVKYPLRCHCISLERTQIPLELVQITPKAVKSERQDP